MDTARYCKTLHRVSKAELIGALHQVLIQLDAAGARVEVSGRTLDNAPAMLEAHRLLAKAGYLGFVP